MGAAIRTDDNESVFTRHDLNGSLDPERLNVPTILAFTMDLQDFERARRAQAAWGNISLPSPP